MSVCTSLQSVREHISKMRWPNLISFSLLVAFGRMARSSIGGDGCVAEETFRFCG